MLEQVIPVFKTNFSIGKSIFTLDKKTKEGGPPSLVDLAKRENLDRVFLVEDCVAGFPYAFKAFKNVCQLVFGLRLDFGESKEKTSKLIIVANGDDGIKSLNKIYSECSVNGFIPLDFIAKHKDNIKVCVPFYDSFIFKNVMEFGDYIIDMKELNPTFFIERNFLPFDSLVEERIRSLCALNSFQTQMTKTIYYEKRSDAEALQAYKIITNRIGGKFRSLSRPNLEHFGSREFCWESFKEIPCNV
jgi:hypothetical protein